MKTSRFVFGIFLFLILAFFSASVSWGNDGKTPGQRETVFGGKSAVKWCETEQDTRWCFCGAQQIITPCSFEIGQYREFFPVGTYPCGIAFDGTNIWVADNGSGQVTKLRASDGAALGTYNVGAYPVGVAFDGVNVWVTNSGSNSVTELRASDLTFSAKILFVPTGISCFVRLIEQFF